MRYNLHLNPVLLTLAFFLFGAQFAVAQEKKTSIFESLTPVEAVKITLETDYTTLLANRKKNVYIPARIIAADGQSFDLEVKPRGKFRRKTCDVPPIKLKFSKKTLRAAGFDTLNEIKLVMPCFDNDEGDELIVKEYIAYRLFEHMTNASVRARLIKLTLIDTHVEKKRTMMAMLVEDNEETAARLNGVESETYGLPADSLITHQAALVSMFEYMIGNTDWEISMIRNVRLIQSRETGKVLVVPYDFDFSGFVSAPYASPSSESGLRTVRERFLMSSGLQPEALKRATRQLKAAEPELMRICDSKYLSRAGSENIKTYLRSFFQRAGESDEMPSIMKAPPLMD